MLQLSNVMKPLKTMLAVLLKKLRSDRPFSAHVQWLYAAWAGTLSVGYFVSLAADWGVAVPVFWALIGLSGVAAVAIGVIRNQPAHTAPWLLFAAAMLLFVTGDTYFKVQHFALHAQNPFPSFADVLYLLTYVLFGAGLFLLIRRRTAQRSAGAVLDALTLTVSLALFLWVYLIAPTMLSGGSSLARMVSIAYPLGDILVWAFLVRLLIVDIRTRSVRLLAFGALGLISADIAYALGQFHGTWHEGNFVDMGWIAFYTTWGLASLNRSMVRLSQPVVHVIVPIRTGRVVLLGMAALVAPALLFVNAAQGKAAEVAGAIAVFASVLFVLVLLRMFMLARTLSSREAELKLTQEKDEMLAISSHQLRTPLTVIQMYTESMQSARSGKEVGEFITIIRAATQRMIKLVNTLMYTSELDMGDVQFKRDPILVADVLSQALKDNKILMQRKHVVLCNMVSSDVSTVLGDAAAVTAIISGVLINAVEYGAETGAVITIGATAKSGMVRLTIADNGHGIPAVDQPKVFTKLFRGSNARELAPDGSGLSLYLARTALARMNGTIALTSSEGAGTSVEICLPTAAMVV